MKILNFNLTMTWKTLTFHSFYMVTSTPTPNLIAITKNLATSLPHVAPIIFHHMDPTTFQIGWCFMCQFNLPTFDNYIYWIQYAFGHNGNDCSNYSSYELDTPSYVSSPLIMYPSLKNVSFVYNLNQKQHVMFMLVGCMLYNSYDNLTLV
jgi:hypothetical protein